MYNKTNNAFTLVELIVVITILAILWTIAFLSLQWYSANARDWVRTTDLTNISKALELYSLNSWNYPNPSNFVDITYSWWIAWKQGTFWTEPFEQLWTISKLPIDPLTWSEYTYSVTSSKKEYQLAWVYELSITSNVEKKNIFSQNAYADWNLAWLAKIVWSYNGVKLNVLSWSTTFILWVPTIISWDISLLDVESIISNKKLVYNWFKNLPASYSWSKFNIDWQIDFWLWLNNGNSLLVYSWDYGTLTNSGWLLLETLTKIQNVYSGSLLQWDKNYNGIVSLDIPNWWQKALNLATSIITGKVDTSLTATTNSSEPVFDPYLNCTSAWQILTATTTYAWCDTADITVCSWSWTWYTISACNVWSTISWTWVSSYGWLYQWWRNEDIRSWNYLAYIYSWSLINWNIGNNFFYKWDSTYLDWWQDEAWSITPNRWTWANPEWPCNDSNYHIPKQSEWQWIVTAWGWVSISWVDDWVRMQTILKLPFTGYRASFGWVIYDQGNYGKYWTSSPNTNYSDIFYIDPGFIFLNNISYRSYGLPIRCFRNN